MHKQIAQSTLHPTIALFRNRPAYHKIYTSYAMTHKPSRLPHDMHFLRNEA